MQAVIICGGYGTRLKKIYKTTPKALVKINGKKNLEHIVSDLKKNGINNFIFLTNYQSKKIEKYLNEIKLKNFKVLKDNKLSGTGGALLGAFKNLNEDFIVIFSDLFMKINFKKFYKYSRKKKSNVNILLHSNSHPFDSDTVEYDNNYKIKKIFFKKTNRNKLNIAISGLFYFKKKFLSKFNIKKEGTFDLVRDLIGKNQKDRVYGYRSIEYIKDFGTPKRLRKINTEQKNKNKNKVSAVFLDRDGVINRENGGVNSITKFKILPKVGNAIKLLNNKNIPVFIISNQALLEKRKMNLNNFKKIIIKLDEYLSQHGAFIDDYRYCPYFKKREKKFNKIAFFSKYRKPNPGMIKELAKKYKIDLKKSFVVGDSDKDILAGFKCKCKTILVKSIKINEYRYNVNPNFIVKNLYEAVKIITK